MYVGYDLGKIYSKINKKKNMNENVYFVNFQIFGQLYKQVYFLTRDLASMIL